MPVSYHHLDCDYRLTGRREVNAMIRRCIVAEGRRGAVLGIIFCSDEALLEMNRRHLGHDYYTDIITFDYNDAPSPYLHGELYISVDTVARNAAEYDVTADEEMRRVIIHGVLHLLGYNDMFHVEQLAMRAKEDHYLHA